VGGDGGREVMIRFYENMINKALSKEEALRSAKIDLIGNRGGGDKENGALHHPFFWSAFVMYGE
jgi:CHAT domain-containing protein